MRQLTTTLFILIFCSSIGFSQKETYIRFESGYKWDFLSLTDQGGGMETMFFPIQQTGISYGREIGKNLILEIGYSTNQYYDLLRFKDQNVYGHTGFMLMHQVPLKIKYNYPLIKDRLFIRPSIGVIGGLSYLSTARGPKDVNLLTGSDYPTLTITDQSPTKNFMVSAEVGLDLAYRLNNHFDLTVGARYVQGFTKPMTTDVRYQLEGGDPQFASLRAFGNQVSIQGGIQFRLDNLLGENGYLRKVKDRSVLQDDLASRKRLYLSGGLGFTRQSLHIDGDAPIIAPFFLPVSASTELLLGYRFYNNWVVETGIRSHQLNHGYSIWDEANDRPRHGSSMGYGGVDFVSIPLHIKHEFLSKNKRWVVSPYLGFSNMIATKTGQLGPASTRTHQLNDGPIETTESTRFIDRKYGLTLDAGASFEYRISSSLSFMLNGEYSYGLQNLSHLHVKHNNGIGQVYNSDVNNRGTGFRLTTGFKISLW